MTKERTTTEDPAGSGTNRKVVVDSTLYTAALVGTQLLAVVRGAIVASALGPSVFGIWTALGYIVAYSPYTNFGIFTGMAREYALHRGKGDRESAEEYRDSAFVFGMTTAAFLAVTLVLVALLGSDYPRVVRIGLVAMAANTLLDRYFYFQVAVLRLEKKVAAFSLATVISAIFYTVSVVFLVGDLGIYILLVALPISNVPSMIYLSRRLSSRFRLHIRKPLVRDMISIGLPVDLIGLLDTLTQTAGGIVALIFLGRTEVGYYGVGMTAVLFLLQIPTAIAFITNPYLLERYGQVENVHAMEWYSVNLTRFVALLMPLVIGVSVLLLPMMVGRLLPEYVAGVGAMRLLLWGAFFHALSFISANFLIALKRQKQFALMRGLSALANLGFVFLLLRGGLGLEGIAVAYAASGAGLATVMIAYMLRFYVEKRAIIGRFLLRTFAPLVYAVVAVAGLDWLARTASVDASRPGWALLVAAAFTALYLPVVYVGGKRTGLTQILTARIRTTIQGAR